MLDERKERVINYIIQGEEITTTAKLVGVSRQAIYNWLGDAEFKKELDSRIQEIKTQGNNMILNKLKSCIDELIKIALTDNSAKTRSDTAQYLVDRVLGKPTSKIEQSTEQSTDNTTQDVVLKEFADAEKENEK